MKQFAPSTTGKQGQARGMLPCNSPPQETPMDPNETVFIPVICDYVFMRFVPSFLRFPGAAVTRISESNHRRAVARTEAGSRKTRNAAAELCSAAPRLALLATNNPYKETHAHPTRAVMLMRHGGWPRTWYDRRACVQPARRGPASLCRARTHPDQIGHVGPMPCASRSRRVSAAAPPRPPKCR